MAFAIASLRARSAIKILDTSPVATSFPDFLTVAARSGLRLDAVTVGSHE